VLVCSCTSCWAGVAPASLQQKLRKELARRLCFNGCLRWSPRRRVGKPCRQCRQCRQYQQLPGSSRFACRLALHTQRNRFADLRFSRLARRTLPTQAIPPPGCCPEISTSPCEHSPAAHRIPSSSEFLSHQTQPTYKGTSRLHRAAVNDLDNPIPPSPLNPHYFYFFPRPAFGPSSFSRQTTVGFGFGSESSASCTDVFGRAIPPAMTL